MILEGADKTGKTTAAQSLCEMMSKELGDGAPGKFYSHMSRPPANFDHVVGYMDPVRACVQDRFHLGAIAYGRILGCGGCPTPREMLTVQRYLRWQGCVVVVFHAQRNWLSHQLLSQVDIDEEMYKFDQILDVNDVFTALARTHNRGEAYADYSFDVTDGWPGEEVLGGWFSDWKGRWQL